MAPAPCLFLLTTSAHAAPLLMQCHNPCNAITSATLAPVRHRCPCNAIPHATLTPSHAQCCQHPRESLTAHLPQRQVGALYARVLKALRVQAPPHPLLVGVLQDREKGAQRGPAPPAPRRGRAGGGSRPGHSGRAGSRGRVSLPGRAPPWLLAQPPPRPRCVPALSPAGP